MSTFQQTTADLFSPSALVGIDKRRGEQIKPFCCMKIAGGVGFSPSFCSGISIRYSTSNIALPSISFHASLFRYSLSIKKITFFRGYVICKFTCICLGVQGWPACDSASIISPRCPTE